MIASSGRHYRNLALSLIGEDLVKRGWAPAVEGRSRVWTFTSPDGKTWTTSASTLRYPFISPKLIAFAKDKVQAQQYVAGLGFMVPATLEVTAVIPECFDFLHVHQRMVVKPFDGFGSRGLSLGVIHPNQLTSAVTAALQYSDRVLLQRQFIGDEIRLTVIDGRVRSILMKQTAQIIGDGKHTVRELIKYENSERVAASTPLLSYPALSRDMLELPVERLDDIIAAGEVCKIGSSSLVSKGACLYEVNDTTHATYKDIAITIADKLQAPFLIVDLIVYDHTQSAREDNYVFLEINTSPALKMYYGARNRVYFDIVSVLGAMINRHYHEHSGIDT